MTSPVVALRHLSVAFPTAQNSSTDVAEMAGAVDDVSLDIPAGTIVGLVGESGSGKSLTALAVMNLLDPPARVSGSVLFGGQDLLKLPERELLKIRGRQIGMIFQDPSTALNPLMTVGAQVAEVVRVHEGASRKEAEARARAMLERVGLPGAARGGRAYPHELSGGQRQRVMIAMALVCKPALLIADEPTTALDVTVQAQILALLRELQRELGMAVLLITHDLGVVAQTCDQVHVMYAGHIVESAPCDALFAKPRHPYTAALFSALPTLEDALAFAARRAVGDPTLPPLSEVLGGLRGAVPLPGQAPSGCRFRDRCDRADGACAAEVPALLRLNGSAANHTTPHAARCFHPLPAADPAAAAAPTP